MEVRGGRCFGQNMIGYRCSSYYTRSTSIPVQVQVQVRYSEVPTYVVLVAARVHTTVIQTFCTMSS
jgi:hypothetical protein